MVSPQANELLNIDAAVLHIRLVAGDVFSSPTGSDRGVLPKRFRNEPIIRGLVEPWRS